MNYVGSVSIIDRGDAPAKAVIDKNSRSLAQRVADETQDELNKVMDRVDNIYVSYEMSTQTMFENPRADSPNVEYVEDIKELEEIIKDTVKKKKYQQQVTVFIVGFQDISAHKMQLLQQVNQFFLENSKLDEEELIEKPDIDLEEANTKVTESLTAAEDLAKRLGDLNHDMIDYLVNYANTKASNKNAAGGVSGLDKGKKKLEKNLEAAKNDMTSLNEKLLTLQTELEEKDEKFQQVAKQLEGKTQEALRYKTAAEVAKKSAQDNEIHTSTLQDEIKRRDEKIQELRTKLSRMEINLTESQFDKEMSMKKLDNSHVKTKEQMAKLQEDLEQKKIAVNEAERVMEKLHKEQMGILEDSHHQEIEELKKEHMDELAKLTNELSAVHRRLKDSEEFAQEAIENADTLKTKVIELQLTDTPVRKKRDRPILEPEGGVTEDRPASGKSIAELSAGEEEQTGLKQDSRPSTKDTQKSTKKADPKPVKVPTKSPNRGKEKLTSKKDTVEAQDDTAEVTKPTAEKAGETSRPAPKATKNLEPVVESGDGQEFTNAFELDDDVAWSSVPPAQVIGRFTQYRKLSVDKLRDLEQQLNVTLTKTHRKVNSLKGQFNEHKSKWETERKVLIEQVEQAQRLQTDAEKEADAAMTQLEEFINEQEKLEDEEQGKRQEIIKSISRQGTEKLASPVERKAPASPEATETAPGQRIRSENSEQELRNLMQQTDDAKSQTASVTPESSLAPWLTPHDIKGIKKERPKSEHDSDPLSSRLTFVADAELQQLVPEDGAETQVSAAVDSEVSQREKSELTIDGLKGEKEKLRSRTSSKASRRPGTMLPVDEDAEMIAKLQAAEDGHVDDEEEEEEELPESSLAPWITPAGKKKEKKVPISRQTDYTDDRTPFDVENEADIEIDVSEEEGEESDNVFEKSESIKKEATSPFTVKKEPTLPAISKQASRQSSRMSKKSEQLDDEGSGPTRPPLWVTPAAKKKSPKLPVIRQPPPSRQSRRVSAVLDDIEDVDTSEEEAEAEIGIQRSKSQIQRPKTQQQELRPLKRAKSELRRKVDEERIEKRKEKREKAIAKERAERKLEDKAMADAGKNLLEEAVRKLQEAEDELNREMEMEKEEQKVNEEFDNREEMLSREEMLNRDVFKDLGDSSRFDNLSIATRSGMVTAREGFESMDEFQNPELSYRPSRAMSKLNESRNLSEMNGHTEGFESAMTGKSRNTTVMGKTTRLSDESIHLAVDTDSEAELETGLETERLESQRAHDDDDRRDLDEQKGIDGIGGDMKSRGPTRHSMGKKEQKLYTSMSERLPSRQQSRISLHRGQTVSVNVLEREPEAQEKSSRHSGAVSAPPAVEPDEDTPQKISNTPREDFESRPVTPKTRHPSARHSVRNPSPQKPASVPKQAFRTPRPSIGSLGSPDLQDHMINHIDDDLINDVGMETYEEDDRVDTRSKTLHDLKTMMMEDDLSMEQQKTLDSLRSALKSMSSERPPLKDSQLERTVTILSLASQLARESVELGALPDAVIDGIAKMDSRVMSGRRSGMRSVKGSAMASRGHMKSVDLEGKIVEEMVKNDLTPEKQVAQKEIQQVDREKQQTKADKKHEELDSPVELMEAYQEHGNILVAKTDEEAKLQDERRNRHRDAMLKYKEQKDKKERKKQQMEEEREKRRERKRQQMEDEKRRKQMEELVTNLEVVVDVERKENSGKMKAVEDFINAEPERKSENVKTREELSRKIAQLTAELEAATDESKLMKKQQKEQERASRMKMQTAEEVDQVTDRRQPSRKQKSEMKQLPPKLPSETSFSGSLNMGARSTRDNSFSVSLPRTITSSEWRQFSPDNQLISEPVKPEDVKVAVSITKRPPTVPQNTEENIPTGDVTDYQKESDVVQVDIHEPKPVRRAAGVDAAPKKKARVVTRDEMLYGDMRELVNPIADNYYRMEVIGVGQKFLKGPLKQSSVLYPVLERPLSTHPSSHEAQISSTLATADWVKSFSDKAVQTIDMTLEPVQTDQNKFETNSPEVKRKRISFKTASRRFQCLSKILTFEIQKTNKSRKANIRKISKSIIVVPEFEERFKVDPELYNLDRLNVTGRKMSEPSAVDIADVKKKKLKAPVLPGSWRESINALTQSCKDIQKLKEIHLGEPDQPPRSVSAKSFISKNSDKNPSVTKHRSVTWLPSNNSRYDSGKSDFVFKPGSNFQSGNVKDEKKSTTVDGKSVDKKPATVDGKFVDKKLTTVDGKTFDKKPVTVDAKSVDKKSAAVDGKFTFARVTKHMEHIPDSKATQEVMSSDVAPVTKRLENIPDSKATQEVMSSEPLDKETSVLETPKTPEPEIVKVDPTNTPVTPQTQVTPVTPQAQATPVTPQPRPPTPKSPTSESSPRSVSRLRKSSSARSRPPQLPSYPTVLPQEPITPPTQPPPEPSIISVESVPTTSHSHYSQTGHTPCITPGTSVSDVQRPVSISSVQPIMCPTPPLQMCKETQTDWVPIEREPIKGDTEDEVRESSAKSRASLRKEFKSRLDETRHQVEERRTKSPAISVPSQKSVEGELIIDDDDDDLPIPDELKEDVFKKEDDEDSLDAGSPVPDKAGTDSDTSRQSQKLGEHPIVKEYLRAYTGIHNFKEAMSRVLVDKDQMSASQILTELDLIQFDKETKVVPQIETMTENIYYVLNEVSQVINSVLQNDRGPVVSSLMMGMSRDPTQRTITREKNGHDVQIPPTRSTQRSGESTDADRQQFTELQDQYTKLQTQMSEDAKRYEDQQRHNMVVMMEMQDTINQLQRELSALGKQPKRPLSDNMSTATASNATESAVMFTRLDSDRNAKIMKKAINDRRLDPDKYKRAMVQMDEYVSLPAQRLTHLVRKYVHHCRMKEIEENVQKSRSLNENVFEVLDKMESLQNQRAKRWADRMDEMGMERLRLANMLMDTLDGIEQESGIFLIKPMYSYRGREPKERYSGRISRPFRPHRTLSPVRDVQSSFAPAPTPASNVRPVVRQQQPKPELGQLPQSQDAVQTRFEPSRPLEGDNTGLMGSSMTYVGTQPRATWNMMDSQPRPDLYGQNNMNTPRILELDINRMMIGQNTISSTIGLQGLSNDRLVNASNSNLRSYMTVNRPSGPGSGGKSDRPNSAGSRHGDSHGSPSPTNLSSSAKRVRMSESEVPSQMSSTQPLPPITPTGSRPQSGGTKGRMSPTRIPIAVDIPHSPPGSSLRQSPPAIKDAEVITEVISPIK